MTHELFEIKPGKVKKRMFNEIDDADSCNCEKANDGGNLLGTETDFTTKAAGA